MTKSTYFAAFQYLKATTMMASSIYWNPEFWNMELKNKGTGERKISKKGNIAIALPIAMAFTLMERAALLQPPHQALRFPKCAK